MPGKSSKSSLSDLIAECEVHIRNGRGREVVPKLRKVTLAKVPREERLPFANICRRLNLISLGLKTLSSVVRADPKLNEDPPTNAEKGEYSVLLMKNGSYVEATRLLTEIREPDEKIQLQTAFCHIFQRRPSAAVPLLQSYIARSEWGYTRLIGSVNLASVLIDLGRREEAQELIEKNIEASDEGDYHRLKANNLELRAQIRIAKQDFIGAEKDLAVAEGLLSTDSGTDLLFIRRCQAILGSLRSAEPGPLLRFKEQVIEKRHWESLREVDLSLLKVSYDRALHEHLFFGSPYADFRSQIAREIEIRLTSDYYIYGRADAPLLEIGTGEFQGLDSGRSFPVGGKTHQLMEILMRDFYRPISLGGVFEGLFPGEYFDANSSPDRVYQILRRTRAWIKKSMLPFEIVETEGAYNIRVTGEIGIIVSSERKPVDANQLNWKRFIVSPFPKNGFVAQHITDVLGISRSQALELLKWAQEQDLIDKVGSGRSTRYRPKGLALGSPSINDPDG